MHEQLFLSLLAKLKNSGQSLDRVLREPEFKEIPLVDRVELLKKYGHVIHQGTAPDATYWKSLALGSAGVALAGLSAADPIGRVMSWGHRKGMADELGQPFNEPMPKVLGPMNLMGISTGVGISMSNLKKTNEANYQRKLVKAFLKSEAGATSQDDAINILARSH